MSKISLDTESGMGDVRISAKTKLLQGRAQSDVPDISLILTGIVPGDNEGGHSGKLYGSTGLDYGVEAGVILGARIPDSSGTVDFRIFIDLRYAFYDFLMVPISTGINAVISSVVVNADGGFSHTNFFYE